MPATDYSKMVPFGVYATSATATETTILSITGRGILTSIWQNTSSAGSISVTADGIAVIALSTLTPTSNNAATFPTTISFDTSLVVTHKNSVAGNLNTRIQYILA